MPSLRRDWWQPKLSRFSSRYRAQLLQAAVCLFGYLRAENLPDACDIMRRTRFADTALLGFVQHICKSPVPRSLRLAKHALLFCQAVWPRLRHHLPESWAAIRTLQDLRPRGVRTPMPLPLVLSMIIAARARTLCVVGVSRETWLLFACLLEVGFFALLRPGELLNLKACDVGTLNSLSLGLPRCTLHISCPKNRRSMGPEQFVVLTHRCACMWLTYFAGLCRPHECLWLASAQEFRSRFHSVCRCLGLLHCRLTPASLRAGGASYFYLSGMPISSLKFMGRWTSEATLAHYIQFATAQQVLLRLSDRTSRKLRLLLLQGFSCSSLQQ